mmetsp:Transcript_48248/g.84866  ORF Transcript_48248/g.84866 Transcript_48248/m.84866 type:complete len:202 (+) Transcript_48248:219-824(+)
MKLYQRHQCRRILDWFHGALLSPIVASFDVFAMTVYLRQLIGTISKILTKQGTLPPQPLPAKLQRHFVHQGIFTPLAVSHASQQICLSPFVAGTSFTCSMVGHVVTANFLQFGNSASPVTFANWVSCNSAGASVSRANAPVSCDSAGASLLRADAPVSVQDFNVPLYAVRYLGPSAPPLAKSITCVTVHLNHHAKLSGIVA